MTKIFFILIAYCTVSLTLACEDESADSGRSPRDEQGDTDSDPTGQNDPDPHGTDDEGTTISDSLTCDEMSGLDMATCSAQGMVGSWHMVDSCLTIDYGEIYAGLVPECRDSRLEYEIIYDWDITFEAADRWHYVLHGVSGYEKVAYSAACMAAMLSMTPDAGCAYLESTYGDCRFRNDWCTCTIDAETAFASADYTFPEEGSGTYFTNGNTVTIINDANPEPEQSTICVDGNTLYMQSIADGVDDSGMALVFERR